VPWSGLLIVGDLPKTHIVTDSAASGSAVARSGLEESAVGSCRSSS
jgi:hypothetical protein